MEYHLPYMVSQNPKQFDQQMFWCLNHLKTVHTEPGKMQESTPETRDVVFGKNRPPTHIWVLLVG
jgi:hypothetical protein